MSDFLIDLTLALPMGVQNGPTFRRFDITFLGNELKKSA